MPEPETPRGIDEDDAFDRFLRSVVAAPPGPPEADDVDTYRVVLATDWSNVTLPVTVLRAYATIVPPDAPVTLVVTLPHDPSVRDTARLDLLLTEVAAGAGVRVVLESFQQTRVRPALIAFVPGGDEHVLISELGRGLTALHHLSVHVRTPGAVHASPPPRRGTMRGLPDRLDQYREFPGPA